MFEIHSITTTDIIAILACVFSGVSAVYTFVSVRNARRQFEAEQRSGRKEFLETAARERKILVAANYLTLETNSSQIFKYTAEHEPKIAPIRGEIAPQGWGGDDLEEARAILLNLYYQSLNLFEVCARFRRDEEVEPAVFASWVAWFVEILDDSFFRERWNAYIRGNYTPDVRDIFDVGVEIFNEVTDPEKRDEAFYEAVAEIMGGCAVIAGWLENTKEPKLWTSLTSSQKYRSPGTTPPISPEKQRVSPAG